MSPASRSCSPSPSPNSIQSNGETSQLLTADQLAERWQVKAATVYALARSHSIPTVRLGRRLVRFRLAEIQTYEKKGGQADV